MSRSPLRRGLREAVRFSPGCKPRAAAKAAIPSETRSNGLAPLSSGARGLEPQFAGRARLRSRLASAVRRLGVRCGVAVRRARYQARTGRGLPRSPRALDRSRSGDASDLSALGGCGWHAGVASGGVRRRGVGDGIDIFGGRWCRRDRLSRLPHRDEHIGVTLPGRRGRAGGDDGRYPPPMAAAFIALRATQRHPRDFGLALPSAAAAR